MELQPITPTKTQENSLERPLIGKLSSGENVYDRPNGHIHETIKNDLPTALNKIQANDREYLTETVEVEGKNWPHFLTTIDPSQDELYLAQRVGRKGLSVFVKNKQPGSTNTLVVMLGKNNTKRFNIPEGYTVLGAYSGTYSPHEPWDPWLKKSFDDEERAKKEKLQQESLDFWTSHALIPDNNEFPIIEGSEQPFDKNLLLNTLQEVSV